MSLLRQDSENLDDAARGESFTRGTSHIVWASIIAVVLVGIAVAVYVTMDQKPPAATGQVISVWAVPHHSATAGFDASGAQIPQQTIDQVLVFAQIRLHDQSKYPLFLNSITANVVLPDGIHTSYVASKIGYDDIFLAYPGLPVPHGKALPTDATLEPGQTIEGSLVSSFHMTKQQWNARKGLYFNFDFQYQPTLKLTPQPGVIIDRSAP